MSITGYRNTSQSHGAKLVSALRMATRLQLVAGFSGARIRLKAAETADPSIIGPVDREYVLVSDQSRKKQAYVV
jgi:hypothetical protein